MKTSKLPIAMVFAASMAWTHLAHAEEPCGTPIEAFESCRVVEAPHCQDLCAPEAMITACVAENSQQCMAECGGPGSVECPAVCEQQCGGLCAAEIIAGPQQCRVRCGSSCMGDCAAGCAGDSDKNACYAACNQNCNAECEVRCDVQQHELELDSGLDEAQERYRNWGHYYRECRKRYKRDYKKRCKSRKDWEGDYYRRCKRKYGRDYKKYCKRRGHYQRYSGFELHNDGELTAEQLADAGVDQIAAQCQQDCQQSCSGACEIGSAQMCELGCRAEINSVCAPQMSNSCSESCNRGAVLLCDGQYLEVGDVDGCVAALEQQGITVEGPIAALNSSLDSVQGASCSVEQPSKRGLLGAMLGLLGLGLGAGFLRRRRS